MQFKTLNFNQIIQKLIRSSHKKINNFSKIKNKNKNKNNNNNNNNQNKNYHNLQKKKKITWFKTVYFKLYYY